MSAGTDQSAESVMDLAEEFVSRLQAGGSPTIDEYAAQYPELAVEIRQCFPLMVLIESVVFAADDAAGSVM